MVIIFCTVHITPEFMMTIKGFCSQVVREIRSTHIHGSEQSELDDFKF